MPNGRPPKPIEVKRRLGNPGQRPLPNQAEIQMLDPAVSVPEPHRPLLSMVRCFGIRFGVRVCSGLVLILMLSCC